MPSVERSPRAPEPPAGTGRRGPGRTGAAPADAPADRRHCCSPRARRARAPRLHARRGAQQLHDVATDDGDLPDNCGAADDDRRPARVGEGQAVRRAQGPDAEGRARVPARTRSARRRSWRPRISRSAPAQSCPRTPRSPSTTPASRARPGKIFDIVVHRRPTLRRRSQRRASSRAGNRASRG